MPNECYELAIHEVGFLLNLLRLWRLQLLHLYDDINSKSLFLGYILQELELFGLKNSLKATLFLRLLLKAWNL